MDIVTSLCVDDARHPAARYSQLLDVNADQRRAVYWHCVVVFFATATRCHPTARHLLYTNDTQDTFWNGTDYRQFLTQLGVEIRQLPFNDFQPPANFSQDFRNGFYKLEVLQALAQPGAGAHSVLLDSDCIWTRPDPDFEQAVCSGELLLLDARPQLDADTKVKGLSRRDMGNLYREIYPDYPLAEPIHFGGELIGGSRERLAEVVALLRATWQHLTATYVEAPPRFNTQESIFDGDEYVMSLVGNRVPWVAASPFIRRIWTSNQYTDVRPTDSALSIWHMPSEKLQGLPVLCRRVLNPHSSFWQVPLPQLSTYLGRYLGVPNNWQPHRLLALATKLPTVLTRVKHLFAVK